MYAGWAGSNNNLNKGYIVEQNISKHSKENMLKSVSSQHPLSKPMSKKRLVYYQSFPCVARRGVEPLLPE